MILINVCVSVFVLPSYCVCVCVCVCVRAQKLFGGAMLALLCVYVVRCAQRSRQWGSEQSLFTSALPVCPLNAKVSPIQPPTHAL